MREKFNIFLSKLSKFTKSLKEIVKKREIAIYAICLMLVAAGYFNYSNFNKDIVETIAEETNETNEENTEHIGDAVLVSSNELENIVEENETNDIKETISNEVEEDYYASTKLERDRMYAENISNYEAILNNPNVSEAQKNIATTEITKINNTKNMIMICENIILTKEFTNCVILINDVSVNVIVRTEGGLDTQKVAQIQNIISREIGTSFENIHISEK